MPRQVVVLVVALVLWSLGAVAELWALVASYAVAWLAVNALGVWRPRALDVPLGRWQAAGLVALLVAVPAVTLWRSAPELVANEGLFGVEANASDIILSAGAPPTFHVHGVLEPMDPDWVLTPQQAEDLTYQFLSTGQRKTFEMEKELEQTPDGIVVGNQQDPFSLF